eukprot:3102007-Heterocapsa_arctica.AAC.1
MHEVAVDPEGVPLSAGAFGIIKNDTLMRLILDRRPANYYEATLPGLHLPHSVCFTKFLLSPNEVMRLHLRDASNYYYLLRVPDARLPFQGIGPPVNALWWEAGCPDDWQEKD